MPRRTVLSFLTVCHSFLKPITLENCTGNLVAFPNGTCYDTETDSIYGIYDQKMAKENGIHETLPAEDYMK